MLRIKLLFVGIVIGHFVQAQIPRYVAEDFGTDPAGFYFLANLRSVDVGSSAMILDGVGDLVFRQRAPNVTNFRVWPDGRMSYTTRGKHVLLDSTFTLVDSVSCANAEQNDLHDLILLPNGHFMLIGKDVRVADLSEYTLFQGGVVPGSATANVGGVLIQELNEAKELIWQWNSFDHFEFLDMDVSVLFNPNSVDWTHANAIEVDFDGNILLSSRHFNEITKIDRQTGSVIWRLGGVRNQFTFLSDDPGFFLQHDMRRLPNGNITLFDNSKEGAHPCRAVEYELDETNMTARPVWEAVFEEGVHSRAMGGAQRLPNGNTVVGWGALTPGNAAFTVHGPDGSKLSQLSFVDSSITYRAYYFDQLPFTVHRPEISCTAQGDMYELTASHTSSTFEWSTGETEPTILVSASDTVYVEVPVGSNGFLRSRPVIPGEDCLSVGVPALQHSEVRVFPNPAGQVLHVAFGEVLPGAQVELFDITGKPMWKTRANTPLLDVPLVGLSDGIYLLRVDGSVHRFVKGAERP